MKNKKGFTLIELLAVIVILAIIMVIAVPQILNIINSSRDNAASNSIKLLKSAIKTQIASSELTNNQFTKNLEGCYEFDFDDDSNSNVEKLNVKNKDRFSGQVTYCNGVLTDTDLVFDASTSGTSQKQKKYYIYNKGTNNGLATITSSESCYTNQTLTANASNISVVYTDDKNGCTAWADLHTTNDIDFSKYTKAVVVFDSLTITGHSKAVLATPDDTGWTNYEWFTESKANASLELDLTDYDKTGPLYVAFTTKPTSGGMNNFNYGSIDAYMGSASATISQIYLIGK